MKITLTLLGLALLILTNGASRAQQLTNTVHIVGKMKDAMQKGQLSGTIDLDTIANKAHLFGLGPVEYFTGEILIVNGTSYQSTIVSSQMKVEETYKIKAAFFGYANIARWAEQALPDSIRTISHLEQFLEQVTKSSPRPFLFKLTGTVEHAVIHVVNFPKGAKVSGPIETQKNQKNFELKDKPSEIIGFFSTEHKSIFTHHDTYLHMHLITADKQQMGHLDEMSIKPAVMKLYTPIE